jgi:hypothetical protein
MWRTMSPDPMLAARYDAQRKSILVAYLLWFVLGAIAAQRLYTGRWLTALIYSVIHLLSWLSTPIGIGWIGLGVVGLWWVIDALLIPGWITAHNTRLVDRLTAGR